jgi:RNA-directed DNA polymerase
LIQQLNPVIRGWANYFRHVVSKDTFSHVDKQIFDVIYRWITPKHKNRNGKWDKRRHFTTLKVDHWRFFAWHKNVQGNVKPFLLYKTSYIPIKRRVKIRAVANVSSKNTVSISKYEVLQLALNLN